MVVGPPGTGKTDVAVQIIVNLYHNYPTQKILIVTHSNAALNDLFEKIMEVRGERVNRCFVNEIPLRDVYIYTDENTSHILLSFLLFSTIYREMLRLVTCCDWGAVNWSYAILWLRVEPREVAEDRERYSVNMDV